MIRVFLDANVYFAGALSREGASSIVLELARRGKISVMASRLVLREADRNLRKKSSAGVLKSFRKFLHDTKIKVVPPPDEKFFEPYAEFLHPKDLPVLAAALQSSADFLVTLDRKHFFSSALLSKLKKIKILTPGDFIRDVYLKGKI